MRFLHYSGRTEASDWQWIVRLLRFHRQEADPGPDGVSSDRLGNFRR